MIYKITINDFGKSMLEALEKLEAECYIKLSKYQPRNLPGNIAADMGKGLIGIGTSIAKHELPTCRKVIEIGYNRDSNTLHREYCIISKQRTLFVIFEEFDANLFT